VACIPVSPLKADMADSVCKHVSPLCVFIGDVAFVHVSSFMPVIGDAGCYHSASRGHCVCLTDLAHTYIQIPS